MEVQVLFQLLHQEVVEVELQKEWVFQVLKMVTLEVQVVVVLFMQLLQKVQELQIKDLLVVIDPFPSATAELAARNTTRPVTAGPRQHIRSMFIARIPSLPRLSFPFRGSLLRNPENRPLRHSI